jgi:membrane fusion protein (multidrug efflux system)
MDDTTPMAGGERRSLPGPGALLLLLLLFGLLLGCSEAPGDDGSSGSSGAAEETGEEAEPGTDAIAVSVAPVVRRTVSATYSTSATLRADKNATVIARTQGVIRRLLVEEGDRVGEGAPLAILEDDELKIEFERTSANDEAETREYERAEQLHSQGLLSEEAYETARREHREARQAAALAELNLSRTVIRAPFSGRILTRHLDVGATVVDGTAVYDLADLDPLYADVNVPERHVAELQVGQRVRLVADASDEEVAAEIERIAPAVDVETGTVKVTLTVQGGRRLRPGTFVRVDVVTDTHDDALVVQRSALVAEGRRWHLFVLDETGSAVRQLDVTPGYEEGNDVEIVEVVDGTLDTDSRVVVLGAAALTDGSTVEIVETEAETPDGETGA